MWTESISAPISETHGCMLRLLCPSQLQARSRTWSELGHCWHMAGHDTKVACHSWKKRQINLHSPRGEYPRTKQVQHLIVHFHNPVCE